MLRACIHNGDSHFDRTEQGRDFLELIVAEPLNILKGLVNGILAFIAGSVSCLAVSRYIKHHQALFGDGWLHASRLTNECYVNLRK